jgi:NHLM bacteriocin system ABC transporter ATP-binding protein
MNNSKINPLEEVAGFKTQVDSNYRRFLSYKDAVWWVKQGEGTLFSMQRTKSLVENGILNKGPLQYLGNVNSDSLIFGFDSKETDPIAILFITHCKTELKKISIYDLKNYWLKNPESIDFLKKYFNNWVLNGFGKLDYFNIEKPDRFLKQMALESFEEGEILLPEKIIDPGHKEDIMWVEVIEGQVNLYGIDDLFIDKENGPFPLTRNTWLSTKTTSKLQTLTTKEAMQRPLFIEGFQHFQMITFRVIDYIQNIIKSDDIKRFKEKDRKDREYFDNSLQDLGSILQEPDITKVSFDPNSSNLFRAMQLIGKEQNITFQDSKESKLNESLEDKIRSICLKSHIQFRLVKLTKDFWKHDSRSLLGFLKKDGSPVAIINHNPSKYEIIDPETKNKVILDEKSFLELFDQAYMFYESFKDGPVSGKEILKFCLKGQNKEIVRIFLYGVLGALISLIPPFLNEKLFNDVIGAVQPSLLPQVLLGFIVSFSVIAIFLLARSLATFRLMSLIEFRLESALWDRVLSLPTNFFRQQTVGNLIERVYAVSEIHHLITGSVIRIIISGLFSIFYFAAMFYYSSTLSLIGILLVIVTVFVSLICTIKKALINKIFLNLSGIINGLVVELIGGVSKLRTAGAEKRAFSQWAGIKKEVSELSFNSQKIENIVEVITSVMPVFAFTILYTVIIFMLMSEKNSNISVGLLMAFFASYVPFSASIYDAAKTLIGIVQIVPLWERAKVILEAKPEISKEKKSPGKLTGSIKIEKLYFKYSQESSYVINDLNMQINPGEFIGIAGPSGSGKTTLIRLLLGFDTPSQGKIYYNDLDLESLDFREVRKQIGTVLQNGKIFSGTIYDNIVCGGNFKKKDIDEAIFLSGFFEDMKGLPMGLHTFIQGSSSTLSGGQMQRLLIARAIVRKPKILIFDEATSALDNKNQEIVIKSLEKLNATRIVIAHRLSTIKNADRIFIMDKGHVLQTGSFSSLLEQEGLFKIMLERQRL